MFEKEQLCNVEYNDVSYPYIGRPCKTFAKRCISFHSRIWTRVTIRKRLIAVKIVDFSARVNLKFDGWPLDTRGHIAYTSLSFVHHFVTMYDFKLELRPGNAQIGAKFVLTSLTWALDLWPCPCVWASLLLMVITENAMMIRWQEHCEKKCDDRQKNRETNTRTDRTVHIATWL